MGANGRKMEMQSEAIFNGGYSAAATRNTDSFLLSESRRDFVNVPVLQYVKVYTMYKSACYRFNKYV